MMTAIKAVVCVDTKIIFIPYNSITDDRFNHHQPINKKSVTRHTSH